MQRTTDCHEQVANPGFPQPAGLLEHAVAFDAALDQFDAPPSPSDLPLPRVRCARQFVPAGLLRRLDDLPAVTHDPLKAQVLPHLAPGGPGWHERITKHRSSQL
jgi:hypothetical protein